MDSEDDVSVLSDVAGEDEAVAIKKMVQHIRALTEENDALKENFENFKGIHMSLVQKNQELSGQCESIFNERVSVEKEYQGICEQWRVELDAKQRQFEEVNSLVVNQPKELEVLRLKLMDELEAPHRNQYQQLEREVEKEREEVTRLNRALAKARQEVEHEAVRATKAIARVDADSALREKDLQMQLEKLKNVPLVVEPVSEARLRALERDRDELDVQYRLLKEEVSTVRKEKERAMVEKQLAYADVGNQIRHFKESELDARRNLEATARRCRHVEHELEVAMQAAASAHEELMRLQSGHSAMSSQLTEEKRLRKAEGEAAERRAIIVEKDFEARRAELEATLGEKESLLITRATVHKEEMDHMAAEMSRKLRDADEALVETRRRLEGDKAELSARLEGAMNARSDDARRHNEVVEALRKEADAANKQCAAAISEHRAAQRLADKADLDAGAVKAELESMREALMGGRSEQHKLLEEKKELMRQHHDVKADRDRLARELEAGEQDREDLKGKGEAERQEHHLHMDNARRSWQMEKNALVKRAALVAKELEERNKATVRKARMKLRDDRRVIEKMSAARTKAELRLGEVEAQLMALQHEQQRALYRNPPAIGAGGVGGGEEPLRGGERWGDEVAGLEGRQEAYLASIAA